MKKTVTVNLNPCIDWQYTVPEFSYGGLNRVRLVRADIAGKGINVAIALKHLGQSPVCAGFNFSENGAILTKKLNGLGIPHDFIEADGAIRVNIKLYEESGGTMTELNQSGAFVSETLQNELLKKIGELNKSADILVLSGSRPGGVPADFYAQICKLWRGKVFLDTDGEALKSAINGETPPYAVKPNLFELESAFGVQLSSPEDIISFCKKNLSHIKIICVSMGKDGAVIVTPTHEKYMPALNVEAKGVAGAGDAMVAGLVLASAENLPEEKFLPYAMAAAAASVILDGTQMCTREGFEKILEVM